ncbi:hypothetical protein QUF99_18940 [Bacillus sp. DX4.1]|uniref:hypothetical protein n=1 Tax=Bacillus sp. DX4.1 TaxID=3055867 RepID=UPI0025A0AE61|nr:hypothetical protein [Bacillus sp. DX4.1]MDM5189303.1 hypothetical protein [Bacillus sp. DX4.1]
MTLRIIITSLVIAVLLYLSAVFLPESMNINENILKWLFVIITGILFVVSKNKWWVNLASLFLAIVVCWGIIIITTILSVP